MESVPTVREILQKKAERVKLPARKRCRTEAHWGPFVYEAVYGVLRPKKIVAYQVVGPFGRVGGRVNKEWAVSLCVWLNKAFEDGYQQGLGDGMDLLDGTAEKNLGENWQAMLDASR